MQAEPARQLGPSLANPVAKSGGAAVAAGSSHGRETSVQLVQGYRRPAVPAVATLVPIRSRVGGAAHGSHRQGYANSAVQHQHAADARVPHDVVRVLPLFLRLVRHCAADEDRPRRDGADPVADRLARHRVGRHHRRRPAADRLALRPYRAAAGLYLASRSRIAAGDGHRPGPGLPDVPDLPAADWRHRRIVRHHAVPTPR